MLTSNMLDDGDSVLSKRVTSTLTAVSLSFTSKSVLEEGRSRKKTTHHSDMKY